MFSRLIREVLVPVAGVAGIVNEGWLRPGEARLPLIVLYAAMVGLPNLFSGDQIAAILSRVGRPANGNGNGHTNGGGASRPTPPPEAPPPTAHAMWRLA